MLADVIIYVILLSHHNINAGLRGSVNYDPALAAAARTGLQYVLKISMH